ncbi:class I SAM-dependent methyltransferase [Synechococcus sp. W4D4]|uniref:class I SAM-dependent methyltransferase n=1 Tax=Synechococcus sp. W4D4 TaxID=3392294 RepID=UPI0039E8D272
MQRTPEPELMDAPEQASAYAAADFSAGDQALVDRIGLLFPSGLGPRVLDLGCGPGNISFRLAQAYPDAEVIGLDGALSMLQLAERRLEQEQDLAERLSFIGVCLPSADLPKGCSGLVSNSLLHHLHDPLVLWLAIAQAASPGARVYVKDLRRPPSPEAAEQLRERYLADAPAVLQHDYVASLHAAFTAAEVEQQLQVSGLEMLQVAEVHDRYLEIWGQLP